MVTLQNALVATGASGRPLVRNFVEDAENERANVGAIQKIVEVRKSELATSRCARLGRTS